MPVPWIENLPKHSRTALSFVRKGVSDSLSIARIGKAIREGGLSISNANLSAMVRRERAIAEYIPNLRFLGRNQFPNPKRLPEALTRIQGKYSVQVSIQSVMSSTGAVTKINANISSDKLLSPAMIESAVNKIMASRGERYGFEMESFQVTAYMRAGSEGFGF